MEDKSLAINNISRLKPSEIPNYFEVSPQGLSAPEALQRQNTYGKNILPQASSINLFRLLILQFTHFMALLLWAAGFLAIIAGMPELAIATWTVIVLNALFSFFQEYRADRALAELASMLPNFVKVYRDGALVNLLASELTVGDQIVLQSGDRVPADARILESAGLLLDNSLLTGESLPVDRDAAAFDLRDKEITEAANLLFAGTTVTSGKAKALVYAVGSRTEIGKVSKLTQSIQRGESTLEIQVQKIVKFITVLSFILGVLAFAAAVWGVGLDVKLGFIFALGIIVANVPEGLLPTVSMSLAVGVQRMAKQNALIRRLSAVETLSAVSVICTDKTGTITENQLTVKTVWTHDAAIAFAGIGYEKEGSYEILTGDDNNSIELLLIAAGVCSESDIVTNNTNPLIWDIIGSPTEAAMLIAAAKYGIFADTLRADFECLATVPFTSDNKMMSVLIQNLSHPKFEQGSRLNFVKGAPLEVLANCSYILTNGIRTGLDEAIKNEIIAKNDEMARAGYRVLGFSYAIEENDTSLPNNPEIFLGLAAMFDPVRPEVFAAIEQCARAGIKTTIITGDYGITAASIAKQIGLIADAHHIVSGTELNAMSEEDLELFLHKKDPIIFSRATPVHKLRIVEAYKRIGEIVAVTGDGVNDTLALKSSHIGIAMGIGGTDVARETADMVLLDNNFATIIKAIEEGRSIYANIRKFIIYIMSSNVAEFTPFVAMLLVKIPPFLNILQILGIDLGTDIAPAIALGAEKPEQGILDRPPRKINDKILNLNIFIRAYAFLGLIEGLLSLAVFLYVWSRAGYGLYDLQSISDSLLHSTASSELLHLYEYATTMAFAAIVACQIGNLFICRSERLPLWKSFKTKNNLIWVGLGFELLICAAIIYVPALSGVFHTRPIAPRDLEILLWCPLVMIFLEEIRKFMAAKISH